MRTRLWDAVATSASGDRARVTLRTATAPDDAWLWPHGAEASLEISLAAGLHIALTTRNTGASAFRLTQALHTYFAIRDIARVRVDGFDGLAYLDKLEGHARKRWHGPIRFEGEVDRVYIGHTGAAEIRDEAAGRTIRIEKSGSASSVVWNPWIAKCNRLGDMGPEGYRTMVCVETANAGDDVVTLAPGATHTLAATLSIA
jgi:D-hexose-6-phosphate mutarotase